jgi:hypothetical protein
VNAIALDSSATKERWSDWDEIATGTISADMSGKDEGWFRVQLGSLDQ